MKKNIRQFSGFTFPKDDKEYEKRVASLTKMHLPMLKKLCEIVDIERGGTKQAVMDRMMDFLMKPTKSNLKVPEKKVKRKSKGEGDKKGKKRKRSSKSSSLSDSDDSSDNEHLAAKKDEPPSNSEIKTFIKKILDGADLEEVTMKTVVRQVYDKYPNHDLSDRKDFIKSTVREIIS